MTGLLRWHCLRFWEGLRRRRVDGGVEAAYPGWVFKTDYILDLVEQCARILLAVAGLKKAEEAEEELAQAVSTWTGRSLAESI